MTLEPREKVDAHRQITASMTQVIDVQFQAGCFLPWSSRNRRGAS